jgi:thioredoxin reductase
VRDRPLGVLGTNPGSIVHAQLIRQWSDDIVYFAHAQDPTESEATQFAARGIRVVHGEVARLRVEDDRLTGVELADGQVVVRSAVFVRPLVAPHPDDLLSTLGCELDEVGFPVTNRTGRTSAPGVWAAGNAADPRAQVITAAGGGSAAAIAINADLVEDDIAAAMRVVH